MDKIQQKKVEIENLKFEAEKAEREGDYGKEAEIRYGKLQALDKEIEDSLSQPCSAGFYPSAFSHFAI